MGSFGTISSSQPSLIYNPCTVYHPTIIQFNGSQRGCVQFKHYCPYISHLWVYLGQFCQQLRSLQCSFLYHLHLYHVKKQADLMGVYGCTWDDFLNTSSHRSCLYFSSIYRISHRSCPVKLLGASLEHKQSSPLSLSTSIHIRSNNEHQIQWASMDTANIDVITRFLLRVIYIYRIKLDSSLSACGRHAFIFGWEKKVISTSWLLRWHRFCIFRPPPSVLIRLNIMNSGAPSSRLDFVLGFCLPQNHFASEPFCTNGRQPGGHAAATTKSRERLTPTRVLQHLAPFTNEHVRFSGECAVAFHLSSVFGAISSSLSVQFFTIQSLLSIHQE